MIDAVRSFQTGPTGPAAAFVQLEKVQRCDGERVPNAELPHGNNPSFWDRATLRLADELQWRWCSTNS